jgi:prefoldin subunit 5
MTDHNADGEIKETGNHSEASLVTETSDVVRHDAKAADAAKDSASADVAKQPSKEITLQRLTPHSSWEDIVTNESAAREHQFTAAASEVTGRRLSLAAVVAIAAAVGAIGGALATTGFGHYVKSDQTAAVAAAAVAEQARTVESAIGKINADIAALKTSSAAQSARIVERIDRVEKAQADPAAKLAKLSEAVEKLRAPAATAAPETTGSIKPATAQPNRLPVVEGWVLREVSDGMATVVGRAGIFDVIPGDPLPGVGRVDAIRRQDGRWVVVTSRGLIVAR